MKRLTLYLTEGEYQLLRKASYEKHKSMSAIVRERLDKQLGVVILPELGKKK